MFCMQITHTSTKQCHLDTLIIAVNFLNEKYLNRYNLILIFLIIQKGWGWGWGWVVIGS